MKIKKSFGTFLLICVLIPVLLSGCALAYPVSSEVISKAVEAIESVQSYRMEQIGHSEDEYNNSIEVKETTEYVAPDRIRILTEVATGEITGIESIRIGNTRYLKEADSSNWRVNQENESPLSMNSAIYLVKNLSSLVLDRLPDENIDGIECFHYTGYADRKDIVAERKASLDPSRSDYNAQLNLIRMYENMKEEYEFWIGQEDFLIHRLTLHMETSFIINEGEEDEEEQYQYYLGTVRFYDFNEPIRIEAPSLDSIKGVNLVANMRSTGDGGNDLEHYHVNYIINISNQGTETARDVKIFVESPATNQGFRTMEARPMDDIHAVVDLGFGETETFIINWEYNLAASSKEKFIELIRQNVLSARWTGEDGQQHEEVLIDGR